MTAETHIAKTEPFSNMATSLGGDAFVTSMLLAAVFHPLPFLILLGIFVLLLGWLLPKVYRGVRTLFGGLFGKSAEKNS